MNRSIHAASLVGLLVGGLAFAGCASGTRGGPGVDQTSTARRPLIGQPDDTFALHTPDTTIRQGETKTITIPIDRANNFDEDVMLEISNLPEGVSVDMDHPVIRHGDSEARVQVTADDDAALGEFQVRVVGHPEKGAPATNDLELKVTQD